ncbi:MAG: TonB-dependent receptor [Acidiferrobacterales bacterium]
MSQNKKAHENQLSLTPIAAAISAAIAPPTAALAQDGDNVPQLEEIIVTATKVDANVQAIPSSVQAIPESMLKEIGAQITADYTRFMPAVNWINFNNGGSNTVVFRGIATTTTGYTGTQSSSVYLDEIPITATDGSQPDIRMLDVARVEALSGPQGTLFGAAAQAGTLRIITNKPDTSRFEASVEATLRTGETSDPSYQVTGVFNIPLIQDVFAVRLAIQSATDGGFIDNVPGHTPDTFYGVHRDDADWGVYRQGWGTYRNDNVVEDNWNSADSILYRISARWDINENWSATLAYHSGDTDSQGNNAYNPYVGDLQTIGFVKNTSKSEWDVTALTIEADLGFAQFVSATSFYENQRTYQIDNTLYYKYYNLASYCEDAGEFIPGYYWYWENTTTGRAIYSPVYCVTPVGGDPVFGPTQIPDMAGVGEGPNWQERFTQEIRLSYQGEKFDWLAGLYYEESNDSWNSVWMKDAFRPYNESMSYAFISDCANGGETGGWQCNSNPWGVMGTPDRSEEILAALQDADHYWDSRDDTDWKTKAIFGEFTWHITDQWNATVGGRWFETHNDKLYLKYIAGHKGANDRNEGGFIQNRWQGNDIVQSATISEFVPKFSLDYQIDDNKMVYATYTEGYRTGGINRANKNAMWDRTVFGQVWDPDKLKNYEVGLKSRWADNTVQFNLTFFYMDWQNFQHELVDPSVGDCVYPEEEPTCKPPLGETRADGSDSKQALPWISIVGNVGDAFSKGFQMDFDWVPADRWMLGANAMYVKKELDSIPPDEASGLEVGQQLPLTPKWQGSAWATYTWPVEFIPGAEMFIRGQASYTGKTHTKLIPAGLDTASPSFINDAYTLADLRLGLTSADGSWQIDLFVNNVTDERAQIFQGSATGAWQWGRSGEYEHGHNVYTVRPREFGIRFSARWGE